jgi:predicted lysophospholipase L1 biosynthesis ABC-type transport system permease subunit
VRHGLGNLGRAAHRPVLLTAALAAGCALILTTALSAGAVTRLLVRDLPGGRADLAVVNFEDAQRQAVRAAIEAHPEVLRPVEFVSQARLRLAAVNGAPPVRRDDAAAEGWYVAGCRAAPGAEAIVAEPVAAALGLRIRDRLEFAARRRHLAVTLAAIRPMPPLESFWNSLTVDCRTLDPDSLFHQALIRVRPGAADRVRRDLQRRFPALAVVGAAEAEAAVTALSRQAFVLVRALAMLCAALGLPVLFAFAFASQSYRAREAALLAALGARPAQLRTAAAVELAAIGLLAGLLGWCGSGVLSGAFLYRILVRWEWLPGWPVALLAPPAAAALVLASGWLPLQRLFRARPLAALREE